MTTDGPTLDLLTRRLAELPSDFLAPVWREDPKGVHVEAVINDLLQEWGGPPETSSSLAPWQPSAPGPRRRLALVTCWLLATPGLVRGVAGRDAARRLLSRGLDELAALVPPERFVDDPDRREELVRLTLAGLGLRPKGETEAIAADRLKALSSVERARVLRETQKQVEHARRVREELAKKKRAEAEAASRYGGE